MGKMSLTCLLIVTGRPRFVTDELVYVIELCVVLFELLTVREYVLVIIHTFDFS